MAPRTRTDAVPSALALALAATLTGAPQVLASTVEPEHRCQCPAGAHACSCPRCAAKEAKRRPCHGVGAASHPPSSPPRGGDDAHSTRSTEQRRGCAEGAYVPSGCHPSGGVPVLASAADPLELPQRPPRVFGGRAERFGPPTPLDGTGPASPEPPPPRT